MTDLKQAKLPFLAFMSYETKKGRFKNEEVEIRRIYQDANDSYVTFFSNRLHKEITISRWNIWSISDEFDFVYEHDELFDQLEEQYDYEAEALREFEEEMREVRPKTHKSKWGIGRVVKIIAAVFAFCMGLIVAFASPAPMGERIIYMVLSFATFYLPVWILVWLARKVMRSLR